MRDSYAARWRTSKILPIEQGSHARTNAPTASVTLAGLRVLQRDLERRWHTCGNVLLGHPVPAQALRERHPPGQLGLHGGQGRQRHKRLLLVLHLPLEGLASNEDNDANRLTVSERIMLSLLLITSGCLVSEAAGED